MNIIEMHGVHRVYELGTVKVKALNGIDFTAKKGEFISIMGPSGSGKSTMMHMIGLLDDITKGKMKIKNIDVSKMTENMKTDFRLRELGFVFQFYSLLPELTAIENVYIPLMLLGKKNHELKSSAMKVLEMLGIAERANNYPHQLSGGEQQRVGIARAIVNSPEILLADEPTASLDSKSADTVFQAFRELNEKLKQTIIVVTHEEALGAKADRGIWLKDGIIVKEKKF
ncbi:MAG TPA: ABC transporter ATP-binding protein [Candidatus Aenigmarchaeota archaeon]|nr:ABC transporter ATP-binding protein [Candidatus Aenigmarchaeota archaeon]